MNTIQYTVRDHVGYLTLNRPKVYNAVDAAMMEELHRFWQERMGTRRPG